MSRAPKGLCISDSLSLPIETVTETVGILAVKGSGKSYTSMVFVEEMAKHSLPVVALDPVGVFWGLRSSANGKGPGLPVVILGGRHADVPLEEGAGKVIADFVMAERQPTVIDFSEFPTRAAVIRFALDFFTRLYQGNRDPLHVVIDEADDFAPQKPFGEETRLLHALEVLVRRGRAKGLGVTMITQRPAVLNKNVLTQIGTLVVGRMTSPQDRKAVEGWVEAHATGDQKTKFMSSLASLPTSEKWIWSPQRDVFSRVTIRARETFDSSATPKVGAVRIEPKALAEVDLDKLRGRITATIDKAKADDPRVLRARIAELEKEIKVVIPGMAKVEMVEVPLLLPDDRATIADCRNAFIRLEILWPKFRETVDRLNERVEAIQGARSVPRDIAPRTPTAHAAPRPRGAPSGSKLGAGERAVLTAIAQHGNGVTREQLTVLTGYKRSSRDSYLQRIKAAELIEQRGDVITATLLGVEELGDGFERLPTGAALLAHWLQRLPEGERRILEIVADAHPDAVDREKLSEATGYKRSSRDTYLQRLGSRKLVEAHGRGEVRASAALMGGA